MKINVEKFMELYESGASDLDLSIEFNCSTCTIGKFRVKNNLPINKVTISKRVKIEIKKEDLEKLVLEEGLTDSAIGKRYNVSSSSISHHRKKFGIQRESLKENSLIELTSLQKEVMFGCLLGDGYLGLQKNDKNSNFVFSHSIKQREYVDYKFSFFNNFPGRTYEYTRKPHEKTGKEYGTYIGSLRTNPSFNFFHEIFYGSGKKKIPIEYLDEYYTPLAMAIHFCDDGSRTKESYNIATCSFTKEDLYEFKKFLFNKYNIECTINSANRVHIRKISNDIFINLIKPYIIDSMKYKLYNDVS